MDLNSLLPPQKLLTPNHPLCKNIQTPNHPMDALPVIKGTKFHSGIQIIAFSIQALPQWVLTTFFDEYFRSSLFVWQPLLIK